MEGEQSIELCELGVYEGDCNALAQQSTARAGFDEVLVVEVYRVWMHRRYSVCFRPVACSMLLFAVSTCAWAPRAALGVRAGRDSTRMLLE